MKIYTVDKILVSWIIIGLVALSWPGSNIPKIFGSKITHVVAHIILFGVFTFLINGSLIARGLGQRFAAVLTLLGASIYAVLSEMIQSFVPGRDCSIYNFYLDVFVAIVVLVFLCFRKLMQENN
jgi:VanZ family protein